MAETYSAKYQTDQSGKISEFIAEEVHRQGFKRGTPEHQGRCENMDMAWADARHQEVITLSVLNKWATMIEPAAVQNKPRHTEVTAGGRRCPNWTEIPALMNFYVEQVLPSNTTAEEKYHIFELIHPFLDGNGRVGKIIYNYLRGTLDNPEFPPDFFGGGVP